MKKKIFIVSLILSILFFAFYKNKQKEWYTEYLGLSEISEYSNGEKETIAIIDTGASEYILNLYKDRVENIFNSIDENTIVNDNNGHGTEIFSLISKIAPESKIIVIKAIKDDGTVKSDSIQRAINYAIDKKATILNLSFGSFKVDFEIQKSINNALGKNITIVAATGDYGNKDILFPANQKGVIAIEAKNENGERWSLSNTSDLSIASFPGENIKCVSIPRTSSEKYYDVKTNGTSYSTAIASGYIALLRDHYNKSKIKFDNQFICNEIKKIKSIEQKKPNYLFPFKNTF